MSILRANCREAGFVHIIRAAEELQMVVPPPPPPLMLITMVVMMVVILMVGKEGWSVRLVALPRRNGTTVRRRRQP